MPSLGETVERRERPPFNHGTSRLEAVDGGRGGSVDAAFQVYPEEVVGDQEATTGEISAGKVGGRTRCQHGKKRGGIGNIAGQRADSVDAGPQRQYAIEREHAGCGL